MDSVELTVGHNSWQIPSVLRPLTAELAGDVITRSAVLPDAVQLGRPHMHVRSDDPVTAATLAAATWGYLRRVVDTAVNGSELPLQAIRRDCRELLASAPRVDRVDELSVKIPTGFAEAGELPVGQIAAAKRVTVDVGDGVSIPQTVLAVAAVGFLRTDDPAGGGWKLPRLTVGEFSIDLFEVAGAAGRRASHRMGPCGDQIAPERALSEPTLNLLARFGGVELSLLLERLGSRRDPLTGLWLCPRQHISTAWGSLEHNRFQCEICDTLPVDGIRLVSETLGCTPFEAGNWLESIER